MLTASSMHIQNDRAKAVEDIVSLLFSPGKHSSPLGSQNKDKTSPVVQESSHSETKCLLTISGLLARKGHILQAEVCLQDRVWCSTKD